MKSFHCLFLLVNLVFFAQTMSAQGPLRQEAYRFETSDIPKEASLGQNVSMLIEDTLGQVWATNSVHLFRLGKKQTEIFATAGIGTLQGYIIRLFTDTKKHVWVSTSKGLYHLDPLSQQFTAHPIYLDSQIIRTQAITGFGNHLFAVAGASTIIRYQPQSHRATVLQTVIQHGYIHFMNRTAEGTVFFSDKSHLYQITDSNRIRRICPIPAGYMVFQAASYKKDIVYLSTLGGPVLKVETNTGNLKELPLANKDISNGKGIQTILLRGKTYIVQGTGNGLVWIDPETDSQTFWGNNPAQIGSTISGESDGALQDRFGRIWIANRENCLSLAPMEKNTTAYFLHDINSSVWQPGSEEGPSPLAVDAGKNSVVYGLKDTFCFFNSNSKTLDRKIALGPNRDINEILQTPQGDWIAATNDGIYLINNQQSKLISDSLKGKKVIELFLKGDTLFAGTYSHGLFVMLLNGTILEHHDKASGLTGNYVPTICMDGKNNIWFINGRSALYKRNGTQAAKITYNAKALGLSFIYDLIYDPTRQKLWIGGEGGMLSYQPETGVSADITPSVPSGFEFGIFRMHIKQDGNMFVSTTGNKLFEWDIARNKVLQITMEKGWWAENLLNISHIATDEKGNWWGSFRYGILSIDQKSFIKKESPEPPRFQSMEIGYKNWPAHPAAYTIAPLKLSFNESPFTVKCTSANNEKLQFKMQGYDVEWQYGEQATYTNLYEGAYTFSTRSIDVSGNVSPERGIQIKVLPPWYRTWWFRLMASLLLAALLFTIVRQIIKNREKENRYKLKMAESELKAIRSQMNPHFIFNCITAIDGLIATNEKEKASSYLGKFSKLLRHVLQHSTRQFIPLDDDMKTLKLYIELEQQRIPDGFTYEMDVKDSLLQTLELPPLLLQPIVENAIIHGLRLKETLPRHLSIAAYQKDQHIYFDVTDNGVGRVASQKTNYQRENHQSFGNQLTTERLKLMEEVSGYSTDLSIEDLYDENGHPSGTKTRLRLTKQSNERG